MNTTIRKETQFHKFSFVVPITLSTPHGEKDFKAFKKFVDEKMCEIYGVSGEALSYDVIGKWEKVTFEEFKKHQEYDDLKIGEST